VLGLREREDLSEVPGAEPVERALPSQRDVAHAQPGDDRLVVNHQGPEVRDHRSDACPGTT
jgi:hypothetical protein